MDSIASFFSAVFSTAWGLFVFLIGIIAILSVFVALPARSSIVMMMFIMAFIFFALKQNLLGFVCCFLAGANLD